MSQHYAPSDKREQSETDFNYHWLTEMSINYDEDASLTYRNTESSARTLTNNTRLTIQSKFTRKLYSLSIFQETKKARTAKT